MSNVGAYVASGAALGMAIIAIILPLTITSSSPSDLSDGTDVDVKSVGIGTDSVVEYILPVERTVSEGTFLMVSGAGTTDWGSALPTDADRNVNVNNVTAIGSVTVSGTVTREAYVLPITAPTADQVMVAGVMSNPTKTAWVDNHVVSGVTSGSILSNFIATFDGDGTTLTNSGVVATSAGALTSSTLTVKGAVNIQEESGLLRYRMPVNLPQLGQVVSAGFSVATDTRWYTPGEVTSNAGAGTITSNVLTVFDTADSNGDEITSSGASLSTTGAVNTLSVVNSGGVSGDLLVQTGDSVSAAQDGGTITFSGGTNTDTSTVSTGSGGALIWRAGSGSRGSGGLATITAGSTSGADGIGGVLSLNGGGSSDAAGGSAGSVSVSAGSSVAATGGNVVVSAGVGSTGAGDVQIKAADAPLAIAGGLFSATAGASVTGVGGPVSLTAGTGTGSGGKGGELTIAGGDVTHASGGNAGGATLKGGTSAAAAGGTVYIQGGTGGTTSGAVQLKGSNIGSGVGGVVSLTAGASGTGTGGSVVVTGGTGTDPSSVGGIATLYAGTAANINGIGGDATIGGGDSIHASGGSGGDTTLTGGDGTGGDGGIVSIEGGVGSTAAGTVQLKAADSDLAGGIISITAGNSVTGTAGAVSLVAGTATGAAGVGGNTMVSGGNASSVGDSGNAGDVTIQGGLSNFAVGGHVTVQGGGGGSARGVVNVVSDTVNVANEALASAVDVNIASGAGTTASTSTLRIANNPTVTTIDLSNVTALGPRAITVAGGNSGLADTVTVLGGLQSADTQTLSVFAGNATGGTQSIALLTGTGGGRYCDIGNSTVGAVSAVAQQVNIANHNSTGNVSVNILSGLTGISGSAELHLANNPRVTTVDVANQTPDAARTVSISGGNSEFDDTVTVLGGTSMGTDSFNVFNGVALGGSQTVNLMTGSGGTKAVNIGTGASAGTVTVGNNTGATSVELRMGAGAVAVTTVQPITGSVLSYTGALGTVDQYISTADPEGVVTSSVGSVAMNVTSGAMSFKQAGVGNTGWVQLGAYKPPNLITFLTSGPYTPSADVVYIVVRCISGGGGGGGAFDSTGGNVSVGGGGGAGAEFIGVISATDLGSPLTATVGTGGSGVIGSSGTDGTDSTFGLVVGAKYVYAYAGRKGSAVAAGTSSATSFGGLGENGGFTGVFKLWKNIPGARGGGSAAFTSAGTSFVFGSNGGCDSSNGQSTFSSAGTGTFSVGGNSGGSYGCGGGGVGGAGVGELAGDNGAAGIITITEYF